MKLETKNKFSLLKIIFFLNFSLFLNSSQAMEAWSLLEDDDIEMQRMSLLNNQGFAQDDFLQKSRTSHQLLIEGRKKKKSCSENIFFDDSRIPIELKENIFSLLLHQLDVPTLCNLAYYSKLPEFAVNKIFVAHCNYLSKKYEDIFIKSIFAGEEDYGELVNLKNEALSFMTFSGTSNKGWAFANFRDAWQDLDDVDLVIQTFKPKEKFNDRLCSALEIYKSETMRKANFFERSADLINYRSLRCIFLHFMWMLLYKKNNDAEFCYMISNFTVIGLVLLFLVSYGLALISILSNKHISSNLWPFAAMQPVMVFGLFVNYHYWKFRGTPITNVFNIRFLLERKLNQVDWGMNGLIAELRNREEVVLRRQAQLSELIEEEI